MNQDDSFANQMKNLHSMNSMHHRNKMKSLIIDRVTRQLDRNLKAGLTSGFDFDSMLLAVKQTLVMSKDDTYELQPRNVKVEE